MDKVDFDGLFNAKIYKICILYLSLKNYVMHYVLYSNFGILKQFISICK